MKPKLYLHIGVQRTGTTSIQFLLHNNRKRLEQQKVRYAYATVSHNHLAWRILLKQITAKTLIEGSVKDIEQSGCNTLIVSGEDFCQVRDVEAFGPYLNYFDVRIICYLRRQDLWLESWYNQHVKWPWNRELSRLSAEEFLARRSEFPWIDYAEMLSRWASVFGKDRLAIRIFERQQMMYPLEAEFCKICGVNTALLTVPERRHNASVPAEALEFLRHLDLISKSGASRSLILRHATEAYRNVLPNPSKNVFSSQSRRVVLKEFEACNEYVARTFLGRNDGVLFLDPYPEGDNAAENLTLPAVPKLFDEIVNPIVREFLATIEDNEKLGRQSFGDDKELGPLKQKRNALAEHVTLLRAEVNSPALLIKRLLLKHFLFCDSTSSNG